MVQIIPAVEVRKRHFMAEKRVSLPITASSTPEVRQSISRQLIVLTNCSPPLQPAFVIGLFTTGNTYDSPDLSFGKGNGFEADPYGLCELLDDGRVGGYFQPLINASFPTATDCFIGFMR